MARIPVVEIPSAPGAPTMPLGSAPSRRYDLSGVSGTLTAPTIQQGAFDGPAKGLQSIGQGIAVAGQASGRVAAVLEDFKQVDNETKDIAGFARLKAMQTQFVADQQVKRQGLPPDQWETDLTDSLVEFDSQVSGLDLSATGQQRLTAELQVWKAGQRADAYVSGKAKVMDDRIATVNEEIDRMTADGDIFNALALAHSSHNAGMISKGRLEEVKTNLQKVQRVNLQSEMLANRPKEYLAEMSEGKKTGKSDVFDWLNGNYEEFLRQEGIAKAHISGLTSEALDAVKAGIANGSITDMDGIKKLNASKGNIIGDEELPALQSMLNKYRPMDWFAYGELATAVIGYDSQNDPTREGAVKLKMAIYSSLPDTAADELNKMLTQAQSSEGGGDYVLRGMVANINRQFEMGWLGDFRDEKLSQDERRENLAIAERKKAEALTKARDWRKANPKSDEIQASEFINGALGLERVKASEGILRGGYKPGGATGYPGGGLGMPDRGTAIDAAKTKLEQFEAQGKPLSSNSVPVTYYSLGADVGGPDETQDRYTNEGKSSKGPNLTPGVAAVNESKYKLGTIFKDEKTGEVFIATDRHGNRDASVVDLYESPDRYKKRKEARSLQVIGHVDNIPTTAAGVRVLLSQYGKVPDGETAAESLRRLKG